MSAIGDAAPVLALVLIGGPAVMLAPFVIARRSAEGHADGAAAEIRAAARRAQLAATTPAARPKELTRR